MTDARKAGRLGDFLRRSEGSVATIFAVSLVPLMLAAGIGVDVSRAMSGRTALQDALDATALALAHLPTSTPQTDLQAKAQTWMAANLATAPMPTPSVRVTLTSGKIVLDASVNVPTTLTAVAGYKSIPIAAHSVAAWGLGHVEVALVLDNTGSMAGTKLQRLKDAALDLVETLEGQIDPSDPTALKLGVVPFSTTVRLSSSSSQLTTYRNATWIRGNMPSQYGKDVFFNSSANTVNGTNRFTLFDNMGVSWGGCIESRPPPYDVVDTGPNTAVPQTLFVPYFAPDEPDDDTVRRTNSAWWSNYWTSANNYLDDEKTGLSKTDQNSWWIRLGNVAKYDDPPDTSGGKGPNAGCNMQAIQRLTSNMSSVRAKLTAMNAVGNTNIPIGLMWGWHVLSPNLPFADGVAYTNGDTKKFLVLLTDGDNTNSLSDNPNNSLYTSLGYAWQDRLPGVDENSSENARMKAMDDRMGVLCSNIKAAGITVYAVRIDVDGVAPDALKNCPSSPDKFFDIDSTGLSGAFQNIAGSIGRLRLAQ